MTFGESIARVKEGARVRRPAWRRDCAIVMSVQTRFVWIIGSSGEPGRWTPWLEDLTATDWEMAGATDWPKVEP